MRKVIDKVTYNTDTATELGIVYFGEFGEADGYEERLYVNKKNQHFLYGVGGSSSKYPVQAMALVSEKEAKAWIKENKSNFVTV